MQPLAAGFWSTVCWRGRGRCCRSSLVASFFSRFSRSIAKGGSARKMATMQYAMEMGRMGGFGEDGLQNGGWNDSRGEKGFSRFQWLRGSCLAVLLLHVFAGRRGDRRAAGRREEDREAAAKQQPNAKELRDRMQIGANRGKKQKKWDTCVPCCGSENSVIGCIWYHVRLSVQQYRLLAYLYRPCMQMLVKGYEDNEDNSRRTTAVTSNVVSVL